jgi:hypothetical protein
MRTLWVVILIVVAVTAVPGCKRKMPEPIPGPKAGSTVGGHPHAPGIAWFQGSIDEAFARTSLRKGPSRGDQSCPGMRRPTPPRVTG